MQPVEYDYIIVGAGVSGLMTALRLTAQGARVAILERDRVGSGASLGNHGIIHSGALYSQLHPEITSACKEAVHLYRETFEKAMIPTGSSWYFAEAARLDIFKPLWREQGVHYEDVHEDLCTEFLRPEITRAFACVAVNDLIVSPFGIMSELTQRCLALGIEIFTGVAVRNLLFKCRKVMGVRTGVGETVTARGVILCSGLGTGLTPI